MNLESDVAPGQLGEHITGTLLPALLVIISLAAYGNAWPDALVQLIREEICLFWRTLSNAVIFCAV